MTTERSYQPVTPPGAAASDGNGPAGARRGGQATSLAAKGFERGAWGYSMHFTSKINNKLMLEGAMESHVYRTLTRIVGVVLILVGGAAIFGGRFTANFIDSQLSDQAITVPTSEVITGQLSAGAITEETADALTPYAGQPLTTGAQAKAYSMMIQDHMANAVKKAGLDPQTATFATLGELIEEQEEALTKEIAAANPNASEKEVAALVKAEIADPTTDNTIAARAAELTELRYNVLLNGNNLRGLLLSAYGWGLLGTIANAAGIALVVIGVLMTGASFLIRNGKKNVSSMTAAD
ncbi:hypothetical protein [Propionibacterium australiense]|nr:hypothetical protein [Propionibacterium australiense]